MAPLSYNNNGEDNMIEYKSGTSGKDWFARHKDQESTPFENLVDALEP